MAWTQLHWTSCRGHKQLVRAQGSLTELHMASLDGHVEIVPVLLENDADVNTQADDRSIPLHAASSGGHVKSYASFSSMVQT